MKRSQMKLFLAVAIVMFAGLTRALACNDYFVCAPNDPWRHTVDNGNFTNLYLYPNPDKMSWDQYVANTLKPPQGVPPMTAQNIDNFVQTLTASTDYFFPATQYHRLNLPVFSGRQRTLQECVNPVVNWAHTHGNVLSREVLADFVGCEHDHGGNPSDQVNVILSPEFRATNDVHTNISISPLPSINVDISDQPATCPPDSNTNAFHTWQFGTANFTVVPTMCNTSLDALAKAMSHEMVELVSDPAGLGYVHVAGGGDQITSLVSSTSFFNTGELGDICEDGGLKNPSGNEGIAYVLMPHSNLHVSRYWSNQDGSCQPQYMVGAQDLLIDDQYNRRMGSGGGMTADVVYSPPFMTGKPNQQLVKLEFFSQTNDDNLCTQSSLDVHVNLKNGRHVDFSHINNVQYAGSWDNGEQHAVNLPMPSGIKLGDISNVSIHMQSGHCHNLITDGDDGWNETRIAFYAYLAPDLGNAPVLSSESSVSVIHPILGLSQTLLTPGGIFTVKGSSFAPGFDGKVKIFWTESDNTDITKTSFRGLPPGNPTEKSRKANDSGNSLMVTNIAPNANYDFSVQDCDSFNCTAWSNVVHFNGGPAILGTVALVLQQGAVNIPAGNATVANDGSFSATITLPTSIAPGAYKLLANRSGKVEATANLTVAAQGHMTPVIHFYDTSTGELTSTTRVLVGNPLTVRGEGFAPGTVSLRLDRPTGAVLATAAATGTPAMFQVSFPAKTTPGSHTVYAVESSASGALQATATFLAEVIQ